MKSLKARFNKIAEKTPLWSSYICFAQAIRSQRFSKQSISRWFGKLVEKDDYAKSDKKPILKHLNELSNMPRTTKNKGKKSL